MPLINYLKLKPLSAFKTSNLYFFLFFKKGTRDGMDPELAPIVFGGGISAWQRS